jgi:hypothetical protein
VLASPLRAAHSTAAPSLNAEVYHRCRGVPAVLSNQWEPNIEGGSPIVLVSLTVPVMTLYKEHKFKAWKKRPFRSMTRRRMYRITPIKRGLYRA